MIYFDENKEAYAQLQTLENWGKTLIYQCENKIYEKFLQGERIWQGNELVQNPNYEAEQAEKERASRISAIKSELAALDVKRIRAMCEPSAYDGAIAENSDIQAQNAEDTDANPQPETWLDYYNMQAKALRTELQELEERTEHDDNFNQ